MKHLILLAVLLAAACGDIPPDINVQATILHSKAPAAAAAQAQSAGKTHQWQDCQASDQAWVRRAIVAILGRRPWGQGEVLAWTETIAALRVASGYTANDGEYTGTQWRWSETLWQPRRIVALAMTHDGAYRRKWTDFVLDALRVNRIETKSNVACFKTAELEPDQGQIALFVRDHTPTTDAEGPAFTMGSLLASALVRDDLSVVWRANLFAMIFKPFDAANVGAKELERARRQDFGRVFDAAYLHRDFGCMTCHNSQFSTTWSADREKNRAWPVPGNFEAALFGSATGHHPAEDEATKGPSDLRAHAVLRHWGVVDPKKGHTVWGWHKDCGKFVHPSEDDPLGHDGWFGNVRGQQVSVYDAEAALHHGIDRLATQGLQRQPDGTVDPDDAFAWLTAQAIVEQVWADTTGAPLTVANYFPRTEVQRDVLEKLTARFVAARFSLRGLLADIAVEPTFAVAAVDQGCGAQGYELPRLLNPWSNHENDVAARNNSPGDLVFALAPRQLRRSLHGALGWPQPPDFPGGAEETLQLALGVFLKDGEPGHRGLDFAGRLAWEAAYGTCERPNSFDFIDLIAELAAGEKVATYEDAVALLKDRLVGEPYVTDGERAPLEQLLGVKLTASVAVEDGAGRLRRVCGALVSTPQFLLGGVVPTNGQSMPLLTPASVTYPQMCQAIAANFAAAAVPWQIQCGTKVTAAPL